MCAKGVESLLLLFLRQGPLLFLPCDMSGLPASGWFSCLHFSSHKGVLGNRAKTSQQHQLFYMVLRMEFRLPGLQGKHFCLLNHLMKCWDYQYTPAYSPIKVISLCNYILNLLYLFNQYVVFQSTEKSK